MFPRKIQNKLDRNQLIIYVTRKIWFSQNPTILHSYQDIIPFVNEYCVQNSIPLSSSKINNLSNEILEDVNLNIQNLKNEQQRKHNENFVFC